MSKKARPKVLQYVWDRGREHEIPGAMVIAQGKFAFVPARDLRRIADALHDRADQLDQETES